MNLKILIKKHLPDKIYNLLAHRWLVHLATLSIKSAIIEQGLLGLYRRLVDIVPDIANQYSSFKLGSEYLSLKVRAQHSFQIALVNRAIEMADNEGPDKELGIIDIGDSYGTHLRYIKGLWQKKQIHTLSVNLDSDATERIRAKGLEAICCRAEDIGAYSADGRDICLSFEMLEHLMNPAQFLYKLSKNSNCKFFLITVPYVRRSRIGLRHLRNDYKVELNAENTHILELSPSDWQLLFKFSGWRVEHDAIYLQYPKRSPLRLMKFYWRKFDFEGFYGAILVKDTAWRDLYKDWE